jgi:hypothetical protein
MTISLELANSLIAQRTYGKQGGDIAVLADIFLTDLQGYEPDKVLQAIRQWRRTSPEFPTPADIEAILNPKPKFDSFLYQRLLKKSQTSGEFMMPSEWEYIKKYEKHKLNEGLI